MVAFRDLLSVLRCSWFTSMPSRNWLSYLLIVRRLVTWCLQTHWYGYTINGGAGSCYTLIEFVCGKWVKIYDNQAAVCIRLASRHHPPPDEEVLRQSCAASSSDINMNEALRKHRPATPTVAALAGKQWCMFDLGVHGYDQSVSPERTRLQTNEPCMILAWLSFL